MFSCVHVSYCCHAAWVTSVAMLRKPFDKAEAFAYMHLRSA